MCVNVAMGFASMQAKLATIMNGRRGIEMESKQKQLRVTPVACEVVM